MLLNAGDPPADLLHNSDTASKRPRAAAAQLASIEQPLVLLDGMTGCLLLLAQGVWKEQVGRLMETNKPSSKNIMIVKFKNNALY